jgi:MFS family permease
LNNQELFLSGPYLFATPFFVVFGKWSDKIGRKWIMLAGMFLAIVSYRPLFKTVVFDSDTDSKKEFITRKK